jgi:inositol-phosphate phosphatase/L-galactose 1-phosphate phosphatase/histidinol-phosphatase
MWEYLGYIKSGFHGSWLVLKQSKPLSEGVNAMTNHIRELLPIAEEMADLAANLAKRFFRSAHLDIALKSGTSPVTQAGLAIETALRELISHRLPGHGVLGEEQAPQNLDAEYLWVLDPIDGTVAFACGKPSFCTLIGLLHRGTPVLGLIDQPITGDRWLGVKGLPTLWNAQPCKTSAASKILRLNCTSPAMFKTAAEQAKFAKVQQSVGMVSWGSDAYGYGLLASGHVDVVCEADLQYWDVAALVPIIEGAGGVITDWNGQPLRRENFQGNGLASCHQDVHLRMLRILGEPARTE